MEETTTRIHDLVRERYGTIARKGTGCCSGDSCGEAPESLSLLMGYTSQEIDAVPEGADLGLGCGAPLGRAALESGMTVLDLGSGAGFDVFLAAREVGPTGRAIGVDMTLEMISKARNNIGYDNPSLRFQHPKDLGENLSFVGREVQHTI